MSSRVVALVLAVLLVGGLLATSVVAVSATRDAAAAEDRADELATEVAALRDQVRGLEVELAEARSGDDDPFGDLLGDGGLDGALGDLLGGIGGEIPGLRCMTPDAAGGGGLLDGLGQLFGGGGGSGDRTEVAGDDPEAIVAAVTDQVAELRELEPTGDVEVAFLDDAELTAELETILDRDLDREQLETTTDLLVALRAIPADTDLEALQRELLAEQVAGFYAPDEERLVVRVPEDGTIRPLDRITLAHELGHAIVDQRIGLPDLAADLDSDALLAQLAVVEGDATLLMNLWSVQHLSLFEQLGLAGSADLAGQEEQLAAFPHHLARELIFPYTAGLELICDRWLEGGWAAVDDAYGSPPTTTAGVLFPERADDPATTPPALTAPAGADERLSDTFGAAPLLWLFEAPGGDTEVALSSPADRVAAWDGGEVQLWGSSDGPVVGLSFAERAGDGPDLCASVTDWYAAAAPDADRDGSGDLVRFTEPGSAAAVRCDDAGVRVAIAPDVATATAVVGGS